MIVPDSITPIEGWKSFELVGGLLHSPAYPLVWPIEKRAKADCTSIGYYGSWELAAGERTDTSDDEYFDFSNKRGTGHHPAKPKTLPPAGKHWELRMVPFTHAAPYMNCGCGIYVAKEPGSILGYGSIIGKVKGWGNTIQHKIGWRVQYAYPSELYAYSVEQALQLSAYGVPVILKDDVKDRTLLSILNAAAFTSASSTRKKPSRSVRIGAPILATSAAISEGVLLYVHPSIAGAACLAITSALAGFTAGMNLSYGK